MNGTWLGLSKLSTLFAYCGMAAPNTAQGGGTSAPTDWQRFGTSQFSNFSCELSSLLHTEQHFYELYLYDGPTHTYYPVPVRIVSTPGVQTVVAAGGAGAQSGATVAGVFNRLSPKFLCDTTDILVRRFVLYDVISGLNANQALPAVVRYASSISLEGSLRITFSPHMYAPVLTINYTESVPSSWYGSTAASVVAYTVQGRYTMSFVNFQTNLVSFFIAMAVISGR